MILKRFLVLGITPIYMGSTPSLIIMVLQMEDHPHIHGEHCRPRLEISS